MKLPEPKAEDFFPYSSRDIVEIVGIPLTNLNKLIERKQYGIKPSLRAGSGRGSTRVFQVNDIYAIALVWWLFQSGLRSPVIGRVLRDITKTKKADAHQATAVLFDGMSLAEPRVLVIERAIEPEKPGQSKPLQIVRVLEPRQIKRERLEGSLHFIPVGKLFLEIPKRVRKHFEKIGSTIR